MNKWSMERWAALTGLGFAVLLLVGGFLPGRPNKWNASPADIQTYLHDKHKEILIAGILFGLGYVLILWFLASFAGMFREAGQGRLATIMYGAGVATTAIGAVADGLGVALEKITYTADPGTVAALYGVQTWLTGRLVWTVTAFTLATFLAVRRSKAMPDWYAWLTLLAAALSVLGGLAVKSSGFFSFGGGMGFISFLAIIVWIAISSLLLVQRIGSETPTAAPSTA